jgi:hypothetical protein
MFLVLLFVVCCGTAGATEEALPREFKIEVEESVLEDLQRRLEATRLPDSLETKNEEWNYGTNINYIRV